MLYHKTEKISNEVDQDLDAFLMEDNMDEVASEHLADLYMDADCYGVFEDIVRAFKDATEEERAGMDICFSYLFGTHIADLAKTCVEDLREQKSEKEL